LDEEDRCVLDAQEIATLEDDIAVLETADELLDRVPGRFLLDYKAGKIARRAAFWRRSKNSSRSAR